MKDIKTLLQALQAHISFIIDKNIAAEYNSARTSVVLRAVRTRGELSLLLGASSRSHIGVLWSQPSLLCFPLTGWQISNKHSLSPSRLASHLLQNMRNPALLFPLYLSIYLVPSSTGLTGAESWFLAPATSEAANLVPYPDSAEKRHEY